MLLAEIITGMHPSLTSLVAVQLFVMKNQLFSGLLIASLFSAFPSSMHDDLIELYELTNYEKKMLKGIARRDEAVGSMINLQVLQILSKNLRDI